MTDSPQRPRRRSIGLLLLAALATAPADALAQGMQHTTSGGGLTINYDFRWVDGCGYRPVSIQIAALVPSPSNRTLRVEYSAFTGYYDSATIVVTQDIEIPGGATSVAATLSVPEYMSAQRIGIDAWIDGIKSKPHSFETGANVMNWSQGWEEGIPGLLVVGDPTNPPDTGTLSQLFEAATYVQQYSVTTIAGASGPQLPAMATLPPQRLPERALDYSSVDAIVLSVDQLRTLAADRPQALAAMRLWSSAGGNLFVYGAGADWSRLAEIEGGLPLEAFDDADDAPTRGWTPPNDAHYDWRLKDYLDTGRYGFSPSAQVLRDGQTVDLADATQLANLKPAQPPFVVRPHGLGTIVALASDNPFPGQREQWAWLFNQLGSDRYLWYNRHGMSLRQDNPEFDDWLIPGVGMAPVTAFRLLITLFVVVIGPLNYYVLWRRGRLHLLLVIVPVFAALVTASLFAYAMMSDGLGVRVRTRSYTEIDQRRGEAVCWARLSYYAGLAPSDGLTFPADVAVYPLQEEVSEPWSGNVSTRAVNWTDEGQQLASGWIQSRVLAQFQTVRARATTSGLEFEGLDGVGTPQVKNLLGTRIERLLAVGPDGAVWLAENVAAGATATLARAGDTAAQEAALKQLRDAIQSQRPQPPADASGQRYGSHFFNDYSYGGSSGVMPDPLPARGRLERGIFGAVALKADDLRPNTYTAIVDRSPEVVFGVRSPQEEASLHVVVGRW